MNSKRLLILGAGRGQLGLYQAASEMGVTTIAGTLPDNNPPCIDLADEVCYMDISNPDDVLLKAKSLNIDGVATCCLDTGMTSLGRVCDELELIGVSEKTAIMCNDKSKMKKAFKDNDVLTAKYFEICSHEDLDEALAKMKFPVVVKATDLQGSNGIYISDNNLEAHDSLESVMEVTKRNYCIVEEYIDGLEFGAQAFVYNNEVLFVMPHGDETYMSHTSVPVGHYVPLNCNDDVLKQVEAMVRKAIKALDLNNCAVNVDLILKDGKVYIIELTGRVGANCLPELVQINFGIEYYKMIVSMAIGKNPMVYWDERCSATKSGIAKMLLSESKCGILSSDMKYIGEKDDDIVQIKFFKHKGDKIRIFEDSNDCLGQVVVEGNSYEECNKKLKYVFDNIEYNVN
ncbi:ATP-grasp domain-containing protein [Ligilactobacillus ruminis]|uniref:ATP-grasp domain-containing protein n=1 Tax=Ligilactobacillus ruminis TaxID=1623 RepID=UPI0009BB1314|nr:ATP-grasp domain-containing protein [Ligilactobacillus ruminis]